MADEEFITITKKEYEQLLKQRDFLYALISAGVDNWSGYDYACQIIEENE